MGRYQKKNVSALQKWGNMTSTCLFSFDPVDQQLRDIRYKRLGYFSLECPPAASNKVTSKSLWIWIQLKVAESWLHRSCSRPIKKQHKPSVHHCWLKRKELQGQEPEVQMACQSHPVHLKGTLELHVITRVVYPKIKKNKKFYCLFPTNGAIKCNFAFFPLPSLFMLSQVLYNCWLILILINRRHLQESSPVVFV